MPNKTLNDFTQRSPSTAGWPANNDLTTSSHKVVGYSSATAGGEFAMSMSDLHYGMPGICKAWVTCTFRLINQQSGTLSWPRIIESYNIGSIATSFADQDGDRVFEVFFTRPFTTRGYAVIVGDAGRGNNTMDPSVRNYSATSYQDLPSEVSLPGITSARPAKVWSYKSTSRCRLVAINDRAAEMYFGFFGY